jgi:hypothetical protein
MDLRIKPSNEIPVKSSSEMKQELIEKSEEIENKDADKVKEIPLKNDDIFHTASKKGMEKIKKQRDMLDKQRAKLELREERQKIKQQRADLKLRKQRVKAMATKTRQAASSPKPIPKKDIFKDMKPTPKPPKPKKKVRYVEVSESESESSEEEEEVVYVKKKKRRKPPSSSRIQQLTPDELHTLYGVFKEADTQSKPKAAPKPKINFINPIKSNQFTHLTNPFNF